MKCREKPDQFKTQKRQELYSSQFLFNAENGICLVSGKVKKNLSTVNTVSMDAADERVETYPVKFSTRRWFCLRFSLFHSPTIIR
jgi:hypothetical protein